MSDWKRPPKVGDKVYIKFDKKRYGLCLIVSIEVRERDTEYFLDNSIDTRNKNLYPLRGQFGHHVKGYKDLIPVKYTIKINTRKDYK